MYVHASSEQHLIATEMQMITAQERQEINISIKREEDDNNWSHHSMAGMYINVSECSSKKCH